MEVMSEQAAGRVAVDEVMMEMWKLTVMAYLGQLLSDGKPLKLFERGVMCSDIFKKIILL